MIMENKALEDIKAYALKRLTQEYGYCGLAEGKTMAQLNSGDDNFDVVIKIDSKPAE